MSERSESNFLKARGRLREFLARDLEDQLVQTAVIQAFEFTFETGWKHLRSQLLREGFEAKTPRETIAEAARAGLIRVEEEEVWLRMMRDRNLTVHTYNEELAEEMVGRIRREYLDLFDRVVTGDPTGDTG